MLLIPWHITVFCSISTDNSSSTCGVEEREGFCAIYTYPLSNELNRGHPWVSPIFSTISILLPPSHADILPPKATDPLQSSPCSLGHYGASKQTSWSSFNIRWNIRYFGSVPTLNYIWHHWLVPEMLADCTITPGLCWYKVTECGVLCSNLYMNLENIRILEVRSIFTYPAESFLLNGFDNYWKKQVSLKYNTQKWM